MKEPLLADDAFLADVQSARVQPGLRLWWLGQSGFLVQFEGHHLLIDPYLSDSLTRKYAETDTPHARITRRVIDPERLSFVDAVLSTHGHGDHLDAETLRAIGAPVVCPSGIVELAGERSRSELGTETGAQSSSCSQRFGILLRHRRIERLIGQVERKHVSRLTPRSC